MVSKLYTPKQFYELQEEGKIGKNFGKRNKLYKDKNGFYIYKKLKNKLTKIRLRSTSRVYSRGDRVSVYNPKLDNLRQAKIIKMDKKKFEKVKHMYDNKKINLKKKKLLTKQKPNQKPKSKKHKILSNGLVIKDIDKPVNLSPQIVSQILYIQLLNDYITEHLRKTKIKDKLRYAMKKVKIPKVKVVAVLERPTWRDYIEGRSIYGQVIGKVGDKYYEIRPYPPLRLKPDKKHKFLYDIEEGVNSVNWARCANEIGDYNSCFKIYTYKNGDKVIFYKNKKYKIN